MICQMTDNAQKIPLTSILEFIDYWFLMIFTEAHHLAIHS
jgi:hypothetical protein